MASGGHGSDNNSNNNGGNTPPVLPWAPEGPGRVPPPVEAVAGFGFPLALVMAVYLHLLAAARAPQPTHGHHRAGATGSGSDVTVSSSRDLTSNSADVTVTAAILLTAVDDAVRHSGFMDDVISNSQFLASSEMEIHDANFKAAQSSSSRDNHRLTDEREASMDLQDDGSRDGDVPSPHQSAESSRSADGRSVPRSVQGDTPAAASQSGGLSSVSGTSETSRHGATAPGVTPTTLTPSPPSVTAATPSSTTTTTTATSVVRSSPPNTAPTLTTPTAASSTSHNPPNTAPTLTTPTAASSATSHSPANTSATASESESSSAILQGAARNAATTASASSSSSSTTSQRPESGSGSGSGSAGSGGRHSTAASGRESVSGDHRTRERRRQLEKLRALRAENRRLKARHTCRHCRQRPVALTLLPCGHFCFCQECGATFHACPVCRKTILADVKTFVS